MWRVQLTFHYSWQLITAVYRSREHDSPYDSHKNSHSNDRTKCYCRYLRYNTRLFLVRGNTLVSD